MGESIDRLRACYSALFFRSCGQAVVGEPAINKNAAIGEREQTQLTTRNRLGTAMAVTRGSLGITGGDRP
jgi:hypothetical protein